VPPKRKQGEAKESEMDKQKLSFLKTINRRMEAREKKQQKTEDAEDRYVATIADKLRHLPQRERLLAKHDIENTLFKYEMQVIDKENVNNAFLTNNTRGNNFYCQQTSVGVSDAITQQFYQINQHQNNFGNRINQPTSPSYSTTPMPSPLVPNYCTTG